ncbi:MAG: MFS transporter [Pseudomonadota bacterium]|nr:MFS transporter [Pseudomonadota bacterium]
MEVRQTSLKILFSYSGVALPLAALYFPVYVFLADLYTTNSSISLGQLGLVFILIRLFDAFSDPIVGLLSDRFRSRFGRRKLWLLVGLPLVMCSATALFSPDWQDEIGIFYFSFWLFLLTAGWTIILTPYFALGAEISVDYDERSRITLFREAASLLGTIVSALLYTAAGDAALGMRYIAIFVLVVLPISVLFCFLQVKESVSKSYIEKTFDLRNLVMAFRSEPMFFRLLTAYFINGAANGLPAALFVFFVGHRLGAPDLAGILILIYFLAAIFSTPIWLKLIRFCPKHRLWCYSMIYACVIFIITLFLKDGDWVYFLLICVFSGFALSVDLAIPSSIQADLVDVETLRGGKKRTGIFFAIWSVATKGAAALSSGAALLTLSYFQFNPNVENSIFSLWVLAGLYTIAPIFLKVVAIAVMWNFPLDRTAHKTIQNRLEERENL